MKKAPNCAAIPPRSPPLNPETQSREGAKDGAKEQAAREIETAEAGRRLRVLAGGYFNPFNSVPALKRTVFIARIFIGCLVWGL